MQPVASVIVVLFVQICLSLRVPPKISESKSGGTVNVREGDTLVLTCEGDEPVAWKLIDVLEGRFEVQTSTKENTDTLRKYKSVLRLVDITASEAGVFTCYYRDALDPDDAQDQTEVSVFVSAGDDQRLLKPVHKQSQTIEMRPSSLSVVPCVPTSSSVNVTLWKMDVFPSKQMTVDGFTLGFDPFKGFLVNYPSPVFSGMFHCVATKGTRSEKLQFMFLYLSDTTIVPTPIIESKEKFAVEYSDFVIVCSVRDTPAVYYYLNWSYPDLIESNRVVLGEYLKKDVISNANDEKSQDTMRNITIRSIRRSDQGEFTCTATDHNNRSSRNSIFVEVRDKRNAFIDFSLGEGGQGGDMEAIDQLLGSHQAKFVVFIKYFPTKPSITWYKGKLQINADKKYEIKNTDKASVLVINDLGRNDSGEYSIVGKMGDIKKTFILNFSVIEPPEVSIQKQNDIYQIGKNFSVVCLAEGCPQPEVLWEWSPCKSVTVCPENFLEMTTTGINNERVTEFGEFQDGCRVHSILTGLAHTAGRYRCAAQNHLGLGRAAIPFFVTEFRLPFGVEPSTVRLFRGDDVFLFCYASVFYYSQLQWFWIPEKRLSNVSMLLTNTSSVLVLPGSTRYSLTMELKLSRIEPKISGQYVCQAKHGLTGQWVSLASTVAVIDTLPPRVVQTNLNGSEYVLYKEDNFEFQCLVTGVPSPNISWFINKTRILTSDNDGALQITDKDSKLFISRVLPSDSGYYSCHAMNQAGTLVLNATLVVRDVSRFSGFSKTILVIIITSSIVFIIVIGILLGFIGKRCCRERKEKKELEELQQMLFNKGDLGSYNPDLPLEEQVDALPYDKRWEFPREQLKLGRTIGQGAFGRVVKAEAMRIVDNQETTPVAVKMLKERADLEQRKALMQELKIMIHLGRHINVVNLLGAVTKDLHKEFLVVVEYCRFGNLRHFLLRNRDKFVNQISSTTGQIDHSITEICSKHEFLRPSSHYTNTDSAITFTTTSVCSSSALSENVNASTPTLDSDGSLTEDYRSSAKPLSNWTISTTDLISYAFQVSCGMEYLSYKKLVHRDLASRNILLADGHIVKICDFGLAKDCYKKSYYRKKGQGPLPIKWMAIESIRDKVFSTESDVWSFGIVMWELFTLGSNPYPGLEVDEEFYQKIINGHRMEKPQFSTDTLYALMLDCWLHEPKWRPSFTTLKERLSNMLDDKLVQHYLQMNNTFRSTVVDNPHYMNMLLHASEEENDAKCQYNYQNVIVADPHAATVHYLHMTNNSGGPGADHKSNHINDEICPMLLNSRDSYYKEVPEGIRPVNDLSNPNNSISRKAVSDDLAGYLNMSNPECISHINEVDYQVPLSPPPSYTQCISSNEKCTLVD